MEFESNNLSMETIHLLNELDTDHSDLSAARRAKKELLQLDAQRKEHALLPWYKKIFKNKPGDEKDFLGRTKYGKAQKKSWELAGKTEGLKKQFNEEQIDKSKRKQNTTANMQRFDNESKYWADQAKSLKEKSESAQQVPAKKERKPRAQKIKAAVEAGVAAKTVKKDQSPLATKWNTTAAEFKGPTTKPQAAPKPATTSTTQPKSSYSDAFKKMRGIK